MSEDKTGKNGEVVPFDELQSSGVDLNAAVNQAQDMQRTLDSMGIVKATLRSGTIYHNDERNQTVTVSGDGLLVQKRKNATVVVYRNEGSSVEDTLAEVKDDLSLTQEALGAFS